MKYYVRTHYMCSTNVAFNMKTEECFNFFSRISLFKKFLEPIFSTNFLLILLLLRNCVPSTHKHRLRVSDGTEA